MYNFKLNLNIIPLESSFIENHMVSANGEYVKIYLYILNLMIKGEEINTLNIANALKLLESDVINAIEYWTDCGVLVNSEPEPMPKKEPNPLAEKELSQISTIAEEILQKPLTDADRQTLYWFYDNLGFSAELIMMLLEHCASKDKRDMRYIEKVAIAWHEKNITDIAKAEEYMAGEAQRNKMYYEFKSLFGIKDRALSKTEEAYLEKWHTQLGFSVEMIALAYEYCIMATQKMSFQYMDKIISNWKKAGISTIDGAEKDHENFKNRSDKKETSTSVYRDDTDYSEIERRMNEKY